MNENVSFDFVHGVLDICKSSSIKFIRIYRDESLKIALNYGPNQFIVQIYKICKKKKN